MKTIAIWSYKGGTAKTTTAVNISYNLSSLGYKTLLIDGDPQGNTSYFYGKEEKKDTLYHVLAGQCSVKKSIKRTKYKGLDIIPSDLKLELLEGLTERTLSMEIDKIKDRYDYIVIDCQPNMQIHTINVLVAADYLIIPIKPDAYSLAGMKIVTGQLEDVRLYNKDVKMVGLVTQYKDNKDSNKRIEELCQCGYDIFSVPIRYGGAACTSITARKPLLRHRSKDKITEDYLYITKEFLEEVKDNGY